MAPVLTLFLLVAPALSDAEPAQAEQLEEPAPAPLGLLVGPALGGAVGAGSVVVQWLLAAGLALALLFFCPCIGDRASSIAPRVAAEYVLTISSACMLYSTPLLLLSAATADAAGMVAGQAFQRRGQRRLVRDAAITVALLAPSMLGSVVSIGACCSLYGGTWVLAALFNISPATQNLMVYGAVAGSLALAALSTAWWMLATFVVRPIAVGAADQLFH